MGFRLGAVVAALASLCAALAAGAPAAAQDFNGFGEAERSDGLFGIFDEVRVGTVFSVQDNDDSGVIVSGQLYFRSFVRPFDNYLANTFLRPRIHIGGNLATEDDGVSQVYAGFTWHFPLPLNLFLEASFGGTLHNGPTDAPPQDLDLGCATLFRESLAAGIDLGARWRVLGSVDHSSHAGLCGENDGITHAGVYVGYRF